MFIELSRMFEELDEEIDGKTNSEVNITPHIEVCVASIIYSILFDYQITKVLFECLNIRIGNCFRNERKISIK